jgi:GT2 family glycosyltransferase/glycosyltransferase involved in cell wall biosynthesis
LRYREAELRRIRESASGRLLDFFGRFKHRHLVPAVDALRFRRRKNRYEDLSVLNVATGHMARPLWLDLEKTLDPVLRRQFYPGLRPVKDVECLLGQNWRSTGNDPQLIVEGDLPIGWARLSVHVESPGESPTRSRLYVDSGMGFCEQQSHDIGTVGGVRELYFEIGPEVTGIRFDPIDRAGPFEIKKFELRRVTHFEANLWQRRRRKRLRAQKIAKANRAARQPVVLPPRLDPYDAWLEVNRWNSRREDLLRSRMAGLQDGPLLSVVMPVYNAPPEFLDKAISSVTHQIYENWELCIADDASTDARIAKLLGDWAGREARIRLSFRDRTGNISAAANTAAGMALGEFLVFLDHDDELSPDALAEVALYVSENKDTDILYSDEDKIDVSGRRYDPHFKPDWSPELLLSYMYMAHLFVIRRTAFADLGGLREGFEGSQDYDLALRASQTASHIGHIPRILYHWRSVAGSTASTGHAKPASFEAGRRAVEQALCRQEVKARSFQPEWALKAGCAIYSHEFADDGPRVAILVPTKNRLDLLTACLESIARTTYRNYEVVIVDNDSDDPRMLEYLKKGPYRVLRISSPGGRFNFAAINNEAARQVDSQYLLFLNNDTQVNERQWLSQMVGYLGIPGVGAVGARLLYPDRRIQHAGVLHSGNADLVSIAFRLMPGNESGYLSYNKVTRNYSAVTAACMLTRRDLFLRLGGFDQKNLAVAYNDVDYCYRLLAAGHRVVYCPDAELFHAEASSRGHGDDPAEEAEFRRRYRDFTDHYYNPNLALDGAAFSIDARTVEAGPRSPIRTAMCTHNLNWEGAPYIQFELTAGLKDCGAIEPIVHSPVDGPLRKEYEKIGIKVEILPPPDSLYSETGCDRAVSQLASWIREQGVELVYGNTLLTFYAIEAARAAGLPSVWNPRESEPWQTYFSDFGPEVSARALRCFCYPYKVVFTANASMRTFSELDSHRNFLNIHDALDRARFTARLSEHQREQTRTRLGVDDGQIVVLTMGTVCERKGQIDAIRAVASMSERAAQSIRWFIVGDRPGEYSSLLRTELDRLPSARSRSISIIGETPEAPAYYSAADIYCCTSRVETFPRVILEAMATGLPIVTTPVFGIVEQVRDGRNAFFYHPGDTNELATRINRLALDAPLRSRMAAESPVVLDTLIDHDSWIGSYARVFREAWLSGGPRLP